MQKEKPRTNAFTTNVCTQFASLLDCAEPSEVSVCLELGSRGVSGRGSAPRRDATPPRDDFREPVSLLHSAADAQREPPVLRSRPEKTRNSSTQRRRTLVSRVPTATEWSSARSISLADARNDPPVPRVGRGAIIKRSFLELLPTALSCSETDPESRGGAREALNLIRQSLAFDESGLIASAIPRAGPTWRDVLGSPPRRARRRAPLRRNLTHGAHRPARATRRPASRSSSRSSRSLREPLRMILARKLWRSREVDSRGPYASPSVSGMGAVEASTTSS
jgi:hypothetical protein